VLDGQRLTFRLSGINNQNFVMRDEQTGTWWQQVSGLAIQGPLKGKRLTLIPHDELMFATWKTEEPGGRVLKTDPKIVKEEDYEPADWEKMARRLCRENEDGTVRFDYDPAIAEPFNTANDGPPPDLWPLFDALARRPVLVVRGEHSDLLTAAQIEAMERRSGNVESVTVAGAGHPPELDEPEAVAAIDKFLEAVAP